MVVRNPPAWNAMRGWNGRPIITQKIASEPKPQARSTVSKAMRRMSSMAVVRASVASGGRRCIGHRVYNDGRTIPVTTAWLLPGSGRRAPNGHGGWSAASPADLKDIAGRRTAAAHRLEADL